jgi:hypothetical protein
VYSYIVLLVKICVKERHNFDMAPTHGYKKFDAV